MSACTTHTTDTNFKTLYSTQYTRCSAREAESRKYPQNVNRSVVDLECILMHSQDGARSTEGLS